MSQKDIDNIKETIYDGMTKAYQFLGGVEEKVNSATSEVSSGIRKSISYGLENVSYTKSKMQEAGGAAQANYRGTEDQVLSIVRSNVKKGIQWGYDYPLFAYMGMGAALLLFPAPRGFLLRTFFQSQESAMRSATERFATLSKSTETLAAKKSEVLESAKSALESLSEANIKASAAVQELSSLESQLQGMSTQFAEVHEAMAPLKHKDVVTLRADVAKTAKDVRLEQKEVSSMLAKLQAYQVS